MVAGNVYGNSQSVDSAAHQQQQQQQYVHQQQQQQQQHMYSASDFDDLNMNCYNSSNDLLLLPQQNVNIVNNSSSHSQYAQPSSHYYTSSVVQCAYGQMGQSTQPQDHHRSQYGQSNQLDYTNIDNLEPSLVPGQMDPTGGAGMQGHQNMVCDSAAMNQQHMVSMNYSNTAAYYPNYHHSSPTGSSHTSSGTDLSEEGDEMVSRCLTDKNLLRVHQI